MEPHAPVWAQLLPLGIFAAVMLWRFRTLHKARRLRVATLWIMPVFVTVIVTLALSSMHPGLLGWLAFWAGAAGGSLLGWQRARLMRLHVEGEGSAAQVMMRQSPAALFLIVAIFLGRRFLLPHFEAGAGGGSAEAALLVTDALLGVAGGAICVQRLVLWQRARKAVRVHRDTALHNRTGN